MVAACSVGLTLMSCAEATAPLRHVSVEVALSATTVRVGGTVTVTTVIQNHSADAVTIQLNRCGQRAFRVTTAAGVEIPLHQGPTLCLLYSMTTTVLPGATYRFTEEWDGHDATGEQLSGDFRVIGDPYPGYIAPSRPVALHWVPE